MLARLPGQSSLRVALKPLVESSGAPCSINLVLSLIAFIIVAVDGSSSQSPRPHVHMLLSVQSFPRRLARFSNLLRR